MARTRIDSWRHSRSVTVSQQQHVCLHHSIHLSSHCFETSQQNVESRVVIPDLLSWLTLEIVDEVVHNPPSSKYFDLLEVRPQVIKANYRHYSVFPSPVFLHMTRMHVLPVAPPVYQPSSLGPLLCWTQKKTNLPFLLSEIRFVK